MLTDLSKAFDCLPQELLLATLNAYGFSLSALRLICSYLLNRLQITKIHASYSYWKEILFEVPQVKSLLFNIFIIILKEIDFASYADDNTPFASEAAPENISFLESFPASLLE